MSSQYKAYRIFNDRYNRSIKPECKPEQAIEPGLNYTKLAFRSVDNAVIHGYLLAWDDGPRPLVLHTNGYNNQYDLQSHWAHRGVNVLGFDTRGFGRSKAGINLSPGGHILSGISSPQHSILRGCVCDYIQAHRVAKLMLGDRARRTIYYGFSFAGAMAMQAAAISQSADIVVAGVPTFGWHPKRCTMNLGGSAGEVNAHLRAKPDTAARVLDTLNYFDTLHFAPLLKQPLLIGLGLTDPVVPPETVRAIAHQLTCEHRLREFPESHCGNDELVWHDFIDEMLQLSDSGVLLAR